MFFIFLDFTTYRFLPTKCVAYIFCWNCCSTFTYWFIQFMRQYLQFILSIWRYCLKVSKRKAFKTLFIDHFISSVSMLYFTLVGALKLPKRASFTAPRLINFHTDNFEISWIYILLHSSVPPVVHYHATATTRMADTAVWLSAKRYKQLPLILFTHRRNRVHVKRGFARKCRRKFRSKFPGNTVPNTTRVQELINPFLAEARLNTI